MTEAEQARTESLDRKAATLASFVSLIVPVSAALGARFVADSMWLLAKERVINGAKARGIRRAYISLLAGLIAAVLLGSILGIKEVWS